MASYASHTEREPGPENVNCEAFLENCARYSSTALYQYMLIWNTSSCVTVICHFRPYRFNCWDPVYHYVIYPAPNINYNGISFENVVWKMAVIVSRPQCDKWPRDCHLFCSSSWWCHDMNTLSALLTLCEGNPPMMFFLMPHQTIEHVVELPVWDIMTLMWRQCAVPPATIKLTSWRLQVFSVRFYMGTYISKACV